ncbi:MAG: linear amide C-N hydrolase [Bacteroidales bacterium]|jgi:choloylglycine hydrolase|nr:linear amide C-N hydrolase [Bacteroidales bacterium]
MKKLLIVLILAVFLTTDSIACVTFVLKNDKSLVFGWNYEFDAGSGFLITNKSGLLKTSFVQQNEKPITWISEYGSITFNQWGKEFPSGGINEKGLVVVQTMYLKTKYPDPDTRPSISELQWIQFQLDNFSTVQEVIDSDKKLRITNNSIPLHYMICDKTGEAAVIEFINGKMICHYGNDLSFPVLGNDSYEDSLIELRKYKGFGGSLEIPANSTGPKSGNFVIAADNVMKYNDRDDIFKYSFRTLSLSSEPKRTQWTVVFDLINLEIHFRSLENKDIKKIALNDFNFSCNTVPEMLDISDGNPENFLDYQYAVDVDYLDRAYNNPAIAWIKEAVPETVNDDKKSYIRTIKCK